MPSKAWAKGSTRAWRRIRAQVLLDNQLNNKGLCTLQLPGCTGLAEVAHHIYGRAVTGDDIRYIKAACAHCNNSLGNPADKPDPPIRPENRW